MALRSLDDQAPLDEYVDLLKQAKAIAARMDELKPVLLSACMKEDGGKADHKGATLLVKYKTTWKYSDDVVELEEHLKANKATEQRTGKASKSVSAFLEVTLPKAK